MNSVRTSIMALLFVAIFAVGSLVVNAQTTLVAGDIAFTGYISAQGTTDEFSFVLLKAVTTGTVINFTDNGWLTSGAFRSGEGTTTLTFTSGVAAGTEIKLIGNTVVPELPTVTLASGAPAPVTRVGNMLSLSTVGDQILAYQGTVASPTFISAIHMNVEVNNPAGNSSGAANWDNLASSPAQNSTNASALPVGLTSGTTAIWVGVPGDSASEFNNGSFICTSGNITTLASLKALIYNQTNWNKSEVFPATPVVCPTGCAYLAPSAASVSVSGRVLTSDGRGIRNAIVVLTNSQGTSQSARTSSFGYYRFDGVQAGETYVMSVASKQYQFTPRVVSVADELTGVDFVADSPEYGKSLK